MTTVHRHREEVLNTILAETLYEYGVEASPETIKSKGKEKPDVIFAFRGLRCVIEGKYADVAAAKNVVLKDAQGRLDTGLAQIAIAVVYPNAIRKFAFAKLNEAMKATELEFQLLSENGGTDWKSGTVEAILAELRHVQEVLAKDDIVQEVASQLSERLEGVAKIFIGYPAICDKLTAILGVGKPATEKTVDAHKRRETAAKIAALAVANAYIFQELLSQEDDRVKTLRVLLSREDLVGQTIDHWDWICENINYVPIFRVAADILRNVPSGTPAAGAIKELANQGIRVCLNKAALRHDLMGRIYHFLLHDAKYLGTYYTSVPAATLLLKLALAPRRWKHLDFGHIAGLSELRVADLACGTGTLLMAANQALTDNFIRARASDGRKLDSKAFRNLHQAQMENVLRGYDVLSSAIHLTASTLAILAPEIAFRRMGLYAMPFGQISDKTIRLGSLDFFHSRRLPIQMTLDGHGEGGGERITAKGAVESQAPLDQLDLCVMNPPFTRSVNSNLLFGSVPDARGKMQKELKRMMVQQNIPASITAGLGSVFVALGTKFLKPSGRIALVLPAAITTGDAWLRTRDLIGREYTLEAIVTSHDPEAWNFSENTDLSEVLILAKHVVPPTKKDEPQVLFVNLSRNVVTSAEALAVAHVINEKVNSANVGSPDKPERGIASIVVGPDKFGEVVQVPHSKCKTYWLGGAFAQTDLLRTALYLQEGKFLAPTKTKTKTVALARLGDIAEFGPDGRDIHDGFNLSANKTAYPALWGTDAAGIIKMAQEPNMWLEPRTNAAEGRPFRDVSLLWPRAGRLMLSTRLRLNTQRLFAVRFDEPALSNIWAPTKLKTPSVKKEKALALWLNSSLGLILALLIRVPTQGPWIQFKKPNLGALLVLDVDELPKDALGELAEAYDRLAEREVLSYAEMSSDRTRAAIDEALEKTLGLADIEVVRKLLGREPVVCNSPLVTKPKRTKTAQKDASMVLFAEEEENDEV
jgi:hypothetical protein